MSRSLSGQAALDVSRSVWAGCLGCLVVYLGRLSRMSRGLSGQVVLDVTWSIWAGCLRCLVVYPGRPPWRSRDLSGQAVNKTLHEDVLVLHPGLLVVQNGLGFFRRQVRPLLKTDKGL